MPNNDRKLTCCRVCGYDYIDWYPLGEFGDSPTYGICTCCGVEFGYTDLYGDIDFYRNDWIKKGCPWSLPKYKPEGWSLEEQLKNIGIDPRQCFQTQK